MVLLNLAFKPFSILLGIMAGLMAKKLFEALWGLIDDQEPPVAKHKEIDTRKLIISLALEGAIFRLVKGLADHKLRGYYFKSTGVWPGEKRPER